MDGVVLTPLRIIEAPGGDVLHGIKASEPTYTGFGEAYFSSVDTGCIKGWKKHSRMTLNIIVPVGEIQFVVYSDLRREFFTTVLSQAEYRRLTVSPGLWMAFRGLDDRNMLLNIASIEHDPEEAENLALDEIPYDW